MRREHTMKRSLVIAILGLMLAVPRLLAVDQPGSSDSDRLTPGAEYQKLLKEFQTARDEFSRLHQEAKSERARDRLVRDRFPYPEKFADRFLALARKYPGDPAAFD